jgi:hypothetical protein
VREREREGMNILLRGGIRSRNVIRHEMLFRRFSSDVVMESKFCLFYEYVEDVLEKRGPFVRRRNNYERK